MAGTKIRIKAGKDAVENYAESDGDFELPPKGIYVLKLKEINPHKTDSGSESLECVWKIEGVGKENVKPAVNYGSVWDYVGFSDDSEWKRAQFGVAVGLKMKAGAIDDTIETDPDKPGTKVGTLVIARLKHDRSGDEPRAKIGWMGPFDSEGHELGGDEETEPEEEAFGGGEEEEAFGTDDGEGVEPWTEESLNELKASDIKEFRRVAEEDWEIDVKGKKPAEVVQLILEAQEAAGASGDDGEEPF